MLNHNLTRHFRVGSLPRRTRERGVVLAIALVVLVAMTLAALAMMRSVDTNNLIAGNLAFQQSATHSGDAGVEAAITWLESVNGTTTLNNNDTTNAYIANGSTAANSPIAGQSWDDYWNAALGSRQKTLAEDSAHNTVSYVIDRMCNNVGGKTSGAACIASPVVTAATGNSEESGEVQLTATSVVYYRITVRVQGPRNTVSYIQAMVSL